MFVLSSFASPTNLLGSWVSGEPLYGFLPHKGILSPSEHTLYISYANGAGPYDGTNGTVHKYNITSGVWTDISPTSMADTYYGYGGLAVDLQVPGTIMVAALNCWWPDELIWRSVDSGATWSPIWAWNGYPSMDYYYTYDISNAPWLQDDTSTDQFPVRVGWMVEALAIDPFDSNHWLYGTGETIYGGHDLQHWDSSHNVTVESLAVGIEEMAVLGLITPPGGPALLSAVGDDCGFYHTSLTTAPSQYFHTPTYSSTNGIDYAGNKPSNIVRSGSSDTDPTLALSSNFGQTWYADYAATSSTPTGQVALSADADTILLSTSSSSGVLRSQNSATLASVSSLPSAAVIASDKSNNTFFYAASGSTFYLSTDTAATFTQTTTLGSSTTVNALRAHPSTAGDIWASTDTGLFHSTDFGKSFVQIGSGCTEGWSFGFGKPASDAAYPVLFGFFTVDGVTGLFKTEDEGVNWQLISDSSHGFGSASANIVNGDLATYGRVFVGTNGRGIFYGDASGTLPSATATATATATASSTAVKVGSSTSSSVSVSTVGSSTTTTGGSTTTKSTTLTTTTKTGGSTSTATTATATATATGTSTAYGQCGGSGYTGPTTCPSGYTCTYENEFYSQCEWLSYDSLYNVC